MNNYQNNSKFSQILLVKILTKILFLKIITPKQIELNSNHKF